MTDFTDTHKGRCKVCGKRYIIEEGKECDCWKCEMCGEEFSDRDMLGNEKLWLCLVCEDVRYQEELLKHDKDFIYWDVERVSMNDISKGRELLTTKKIESE